MISRFRIKPFPLKTATEREYLAANAFLNAMRVERLPDDPPVPLQEQIQAVQNIPTFIDVHAWAVWNADESAIIAHSTVSLFNVETNRHLAEFGIDVLLPYRRNGIARQLLAHVLEVARANSRSLLMTNTTERIPAGQAFMERLGASRGLEEHINQLSLDKLNHELIRQWQERVRERAAGFEVGCWEGPIPEAYLDASAGLFEVMNSAPRGGLQLEDFRATPDRIRQMESHLAATGTTRWIMFARETVTGNLAGFTEITWNPNRPMLLGQNGTGVLPVYRNKGLGRWLKAAMIDKVLRERPEAKFIRTSNADSNAAMLTINCELGFRPYFSQCIWQIETDKASDYLREKETALA